MRNEANHMHVYSKAKSIKFHSQSWKAAIRLGIDSDVTSNDWIFETMSHNGCFICVSNENLLEK